MTWATRISRGPFVKTLQDYYSSFPSLITIASLIATASSNNNSNSNSDSGSGSGSGSYTYIISGEAEFAAVGASGSNSKTDK
jgi:hypothetical protein